MVGNGEGGQLGREMVGNLWWAICKEVGNLWWEMGKVGNFQLATCVGKLGKRWEIGQLGVGNDGQFVVGNLQRGGKLGNLGWEMPAEENGSEWSLFLASNGHSENKLSNEITETNKEYFIFSRMISFQRLPVRRRRVEPKKSEEQELPVPVANFTSSDLLTIFYIVQSLYTVQNLPPATSLSVPVANYMWSDP